MSKSPVIKVEGLTKSYGDFEAVRGIDLTVEAGEIFAFLGPNGAGKTTTVEILEGYRDRSGGDVEVLGVDPAEASLDWRVRIGVVLQECELISEFTVWESISQYAGYYPHPRGVEETISLVGLEEQRDTRAGRLSGGQRRRLDVGLALVGDPELLFLDEPTTGFDPLARRQAWDVVRSLGELGKTVFLTTHYMDEAEELADRVAIIAEGNIVAEGAPDRIGGPESSLTRISFSLPDGIEPDRLPPRVVTDRVGSEPGEAGDGFIHLRSADPTRALAELTEWAIAEGVELGDLEAVRPSLESVYLDLTGAEAGRE